MCSFYGTRLRARGDYSPRATPLQPLRSHYMRESAERARAFGCHCSWFSLSSFCVSLDTRLALSFSLSARASSLRVALPALVLFSSICRRSAFDCADALPRLGPFSSYLSRLSLIACDYYTSKL